uniref:Uncharacterized protein n=1 Tax=Candidatus Kentrum sp. FW TaxID=2126338 RepID=A0A450T4W5_9GAMM|nr:MAG: hypothetical protein BECKFW1821B_GA0114236_10661 [Candidatus Kentron sp. FW]
MNTIKLVKRFKARIDHFSKIDLFHRDAKNKIYQTIKRKVEKASKLTPHGDLIYLDVDKESLPTKPNLLAFDQRNIQFKSVENRRYRPPPPTPEVQNWNITHERPPRKHSQVNSDTMRVHIYTKRIFNEKIGKKIMEISRQLQNIGSPFKIVVVGYKPPTKKYFEDFIKKHDIPESSYTSKKFTKESVKAGYEGENKRIDWSYYICDVGPGNNNTLMSCLSKLNNKLKLSTSDIRGSSNTSDYNVFSNAFSNAFSKILSWRW